MPQTIYLPYDHRWRVAEQAFQGLTGGLMNFALAKMQYNMKAEQQDRQLKAAEILSKREIEEKKLAASTLAKNQEKQIGLRGKEARQTAKEKPVAPKTETSRVQQYEFAQQQYIEGKGPDPGPFNSWLTEQSKASAMKIGFGEKLEQRKQTQIQDAEITIQSKIKSPNFRETGIENVKKSLASKDDWEFMPEYVREEKIFNEMDRIIKEGYPNETVAYDETRRGWYTLKGKLIKKYDFWILPKGKRH
jgi:hypothetical protein